jgi:hypothetical protein
MKSVVLKAFLLFFFLSFQNVYSVEITGKNVEAYLEFDYNKSYNYNADITFTGELELNNIFLFKGGLSLGETADVLGINLFQAAHVKPFKKIPLDFSLLYIYNGLPGYEVHTNTIMPVITYNFKRSGLSLGYNFRFTSFFGEDDLFETVLSFAWYFTFINKEKFSIGFRIANFNNFEAGNMGSYTIDLYSAIRVTDNWKVINGFEFLPTGIGSGTTVFYGFILRAGVKYSW